MTKLENEWITKALKDSDSATFILNSKKDYYDQICFLFQQSIEKLLKAYLIKNRADISKTHDLVKLVTDCSKYNTKFLEWKNKALSLTTYAVDFRYPGETATMEEAQEAHKITEEFSKFILDLFK